MPDLKYNGQRPSALYYGSAQVYRAYYGAILVWEAIAGIIAAAGSYVVTGTVAALRRGWKLSAGVGSYAVTGTAASLVKTWKLATDGGSYAISGTAAALLRGFPLAAAAGGYLIAGGTAALRKTWNALVGGEGTYETTGGDADLLYAANAPLEADPGDYAVTGDDSALARGWALAAGAASYLISGTVAAILKPWRLALDAGSYALTGTAATPKRGLKMVAAAASYAVSGVAATLSRKFAALGTVDIDSAATTHTINSALLGPGFTHIIGVVGWHTNSATRTLNSGSIDGQSITVIDQQHNTEGSIEQGMAMFIAPATGAATGNIALTFNGSITNLAVGWFGATLASSTPVATGKRQTNVDGSAVNLATTNGGFIIGISVSDNNTVTPDITNLTLFGTNITITTGYECSIEYLYPTSGSTVSLDSPEDWLAASFF